jgi:hypothetical protein
MKKFWILLLSAMIAVVRLPGVAFSAIVALWLGFAAPVAAGYDEGAAAFIRGDYEEAWQEWLVLGERGHQSAQYDRGLPAAQMRLGNAYMEGKGVTEDLKEAYFWFTLAATHFSLGEQHEQAVAARESTGAGLTRAQITAVLQRAMSWKPLPQAVGVAWLRTAAVRMGLAPARQAPRKNSPKSRKPKPGMGPGNRENGRPR